MAEERILDKIKKLLELARSKANPHEAALAAQRAQELMLKYKVETRDLKQSEIARELLQQGEVEEWEQLLVNAAAYAFNCQAIFQMFNSAWHNPTFIGRPDDIEAAIYLYGYLHRELDELANGYREGEEIRPGVYRTSMPFTTFMSSGASGTDGFMSFAINFGNFDTEVMLPPEERSDQWKRDFKLGAAAMVNNRLHTQKQQAAPQGSTTALVLQRDAKAVQDYMQEEFPDIRKADEPPKLANPAIESGLRAGRKVRLDSPEHDLEAKKNQLEE